KQHKSFLIDPPRNCTLLFRNALRTQLVPRRLPGAGSCGNPGATCPYLKRERHFSVTPLSQNETLKKLPKSCEPKRSEDRLRDIPRYDSGRTLSPKSARLFFLRSA